MYFCGHQINMQLNRSQTIQLIVRFCVIFLIINRSMDEQIDIRKCCIGNKMEEEPFHSKNSSFTKYKYEQELLNISNKSSHSMKQEGTQDLLRNLSSSDPLKMVDEIDISVKSSGEINKQNFLRNSNDQQDKAKLGQMTLELDEKGPQCIQNQTCQQTPLTHLCDCKVFGKDMYCPKYCICYNKPERCSKTKCCSDCYEVKQERLKFLLEERDPELLTNTKRADLDVGIYIEGVKKPPKKFREERCECRNSRCQNKYCVCFTAGNKCSVKCLCENCKNSDFTSSDQSGMSKIVKPVKPYLESSSNDSLSQKMQFQPPQLPF